MDAPLSRRHLVTGHTLAGRAVVISEGEVEAFALAPSARARLLGGRDMPARFPETELPVNPESALPPPGGWRFSTLTVDAGGSSAYHQFIAQALGARADQSQPGFHTTPTQDVVIILDGEFVLELDEGVERTLARGDSAVLNGVRHRWHNRGTGPATLAAIMLGAHDQRG